MKKSEWRRCERCNGKGHIPHDPTTPCPACSDGTGTELGSGKISPRRVTSKAPVRR